MTEPAQHQTADADDQDRVSVTVVMNSDSDSAPPAPPPQRKPKGRPRKVQPTPDVPVAPALPEAIKPAGPDLHPPAKHVVHSFTAADIMEHRGMAYDEGFQQALALAAIVVGAFAALAIVYYWRRAPVVAEAVARSVEDLTQITTL